MTPKAKKLALLGCLVVCAGVWAPVAREQLALGPTDEELTWMLLPDDPVGELPGQHKPPTGRPTEGGLALARATQRRAEEASGERGTIGELLAGLQNFAGAVPTRSLDEIAGDWARARAGQSVPLPPPARSSAPDLEGARSLLHGYLGAHPFRGTVHLGEDRLALFGPHVVRVGEVLPGSEIRVGLIDPQRVHLTVHGVDQAVNLPPIRAAGAGSGRDGGRLTELDGAEAPHFLPQGPPDTQ